MHIIEGDTVCVEVVRVKEKALQGSSKLISCLKDFMNGKSRISYCSFSFLIRSLY